MKKLTIAVDFDGTIVVQDYPKIGRLMTGAEVINKWYEDHTIVINTCRSGAYMDDCRDFLDASGIKYHFLNENAPELIKQYNGDTRKISADLYFDDKNAGGFMGWKKADKYVQWMANRKPVIICIVGESGSGKTTLSEYIEGNFGVQMIQSYTTRPRRTPDENGHTFVSDAEFDTFDESDMIAKTEFGGHRYCCLKSDVRDENTYVLDEVGLRYLKENYSDIYDIKSIRVTCNREERIQRAGKERVDRDEGMFTLPFPVFDMMWRTDAWRDESYQRKDEYEKLDNFINKSLNRGWI